MLKNKILAQSIAFALLSNVSLSYGANQAPENVIPSSFTVKQGASIALTSIAVKDDASGKIKVTLEVPAGQGSLSAKSAQGVVAKTLNEQSVELLGSVKQLNQYLSNKKTAPVFKAGADFSGNVQLTMLTNDLGQGSSKSGAIHLPEINGGAGINRAPAGWQMATHTPDIINGNGPWPGGNYVIIDIDGGNSPYGGSMGLFLERADGSTPAESWKTLVSGLNKGENYTFRLAWQQATVKREDGTGAIYSGGQLRVLVDGKENLFNATGSAAGDGWQYADLSFVAEKNSSEIQIGVQSNTSNTDGESIVVDTGVTPIKTTSFASINVMPASLAVAEVKTQPVAEKPVETPKAKPATKASSSPENTTVAPIASSGFASTGKLNSAGGLVPQPTIDIVPAMINVANVTEVPVTGACLSGATVNISCYNGNNTNNLLSPAPTATCTASNAYSTLNFIVRRNRGMYCQPSGG
jgi:hypothetical protein